MTQDNQEKCCEKCNYTQRTAEDFCKYKFCPCHSPVSKEEEIAKGIQERILP